MEKTHYKKLRNPNFIGSYELMTGGAPIELNVTISNAEKRQVQNGDKKEEAMVIDLVGQKPMIVNSTNAKSISKAIGSPYIEDWIGKSITLYVAKIKAFGETVDALRVRNTMPVQSLPEFLSTNKNYQRAIDGVLSGNNTLDTVLETISKTYTISEATKQMMKDATTKPV